MGRKEREGRGGGGKGRKPDHKGEGEEKATGLKIGIVFSLGLLQVSSTKNHPNQNCLVSKL